jgi:hypothetical protein
MYVQLFLLHYPALPHSPISPPLHQIPLPPPEVVLIWNRIKPYPFTDAYGAWPDRRMVGGARRTIFEGVSKFLAKEGVVEGQYVIEE